jgi:hypothetical protein
LHSIEQKKVEPGREEKCCAGTKGARSPHSRLSDRVEGLRNAHAIGSWVDVGLNPGEKIEAGPLNSDAGRPAPSRKADPWITLL